MESKDLAKLFEKIYGNNSWGHSPMKEAYFSGQGSSPEFTKKYEAFVVNFIENNNIHTLVDLGSGDFQVARRIIKQCSRKLNYIGCDIAQNLISYNIATFSQPNIQFKCLDMICDPLPKGDLVLIREVLQHLSNKQAIAALGNIQLYYEIAIITEAIMLHPVEFNLDKEPSAETRDKLNSGLYLDKPPFNLSVAETFDVPCSSTEAYRTIVAKFPKDQSSFCKQI